MNVRTCLLFVLSLCFGAAPAVAQDYLYATGSPTFSSSLPIDHGSIDLNNGSLQIEIPIATKPQRGQLALQEMLIYNSRLWKTVSSGSSSVWSPTNVPNGTGGWTFSSGASSGTIAFTTADGTDYHNPGCNSNVTVPYSLYRNWIWTDPFGTPHLFPGVNTINYQPGGPHCLNPEGAVPSSSGRAGDGSGYTLSLANFTTPTITDIHGIVYHPTLSNAQPQAAQDVVSDQNGNYWSTDSNGNLIDTSGVTPVLATTSGSTTTYAVLGVNATRNNYSVVNAPVSFSTSFGQAGTDEASGSFEAVQSIKLPDGSSYMFTYDSSSSPGHYGELLSMTLPTGGVVTFTYSNFTDAYGNVNRWVSSVTRDNGTTSITPSVGTPCTISASCSQYTTVGTPDGNSIGYTFDMDSSSLTGAGSRTDSIQYSKVVSGNATLLRTEAMAYSYSSYSVGYYLDGNYQQTGTYQMVSGTTSTVQLNDVNLTSQVITTYPFFNLLPYKVKTWNYGNSPSDPPDTETTYQYVNTAVDHPSSVVVQDGSSNQMSSTTYGYDETTPTKTSGLPQHTAGVNSGNLTSEHQWINTTGQALSTTMTYDDAGAMLTSTSPNGMTTYGHDATDTFVTSTTDPPVPSGVTLETLTAYDASTGAVTSTTDPNNQVTSYSSFDMFNRPTLISYPDGGSTTIIYRSPNQVGVFRAQSSNHAMETETLYDGYGRVSRVAVAKNASASDWYQTDTCYDTDGRASFASYAYEGTGWGTAKVCSGSGDTTSYDALSRPLSITHGDGTRIGYEYKGRATEVTDENGVARIAQANAFGRPTSVCEISSNTLEGDAPIACGTDIAGTGFVTTYAYNLASHLTTVTQGVQTRMFQTDSLGRTIATSEPERGSTTYTYTYNSTGLQVVRTRPRANQTSASVTTTTTTQYDAVGRPISIAYSDGTPARYFRYDASAGWSQTQTNLKGRLSVAYTPVLGNTDTSIFGYDQMGRTVLVGHCFPYTCTNANDTNKGSTATYDWLGNLTSQSDATNQTVSYTYNQANQITGINQSNTAAGNPPQLISNVQEGPDGPVSYQQGNGLGEYRTYDVLGRNTGKWLCQGTSPSYHCETGSEHQIYGTELGWSGSQVTSSCDTVMGCRSLGYDEFGRLDSLTATSGNNQSFTWVYDRYGNRWQQNVTAGSGPQAQIGFDKANNRDCDSCYDAAGDMIGDGIHAYTYDAEGNVTAVDGGSTATYTYDALNRRFRIENASNTIDYQFDAAGQRLVVWQESANFGIRGNTYWGNTPIVYHGPNGTEYFEQQDWEGTERVRTDYTGAVVASDFSLAFGDGFSVSGTDDDPYHFAGTDRDSESATDHAQFRQYREATGRWMSPDPWNGSYIFSNPQSLNRYVYVLANPLAQVDPLGLGDPPLCTSGSQDPEAPPLPPCPPPAPTFPEFPNCGGVCNSSGGSTSGGGAPSNFNCHDLAAGKTPSGSASSWWSGYVNASSMLDNWLAGTGPTDTTFGPNSPESQQMMGAYGLAGNVSNFLAGGASSGNQGFGLGGLFASGLNPTAQFVGSYHWNMALSGGNLNITLTNTTTAWSFFYHAPGVNPNPATRFDSVFNPGRHPMGRVNQTFQIQVPCS